jgi:TolB-like protein/AraC-like DNA-binding protein
MKEQPSRRLVAIMFTDIVGYTAMMQQDESAASAVRKRHREVFDQQHQNFSGEIIQYYGDGTLSVFQSGVQAVECAIAIQRALNSNKPVPLRIGLHMGDIVFDGTEIYGDGVNFASRIESMGVPGAILLSGKLNDELKNHPGITTRSLGYFELKNIEQPVEVFTVTDEGIRIAERSELKGKRKEKSRTIAVLPFTNRSASKEHEYFSDGMTEEIINALASIKGLKVTSRTSSFFFKNKDIPLPEIGKELNVSTIMEGSIRLIGNRMRLTAQLIDVREDYHFWSESFDRSIEDIFAVQDEISLLIADRLREHLGHFELEDKLVEDLNIPVEVYKQYLKGRYHLMKLNRQGTEKAVEIFREIIDEHPTFPLPYLDIHQGYTFLGVLGVMPAPESFVKARPYLEKALELDENLPESQLNLSWTACWQDWDLERAYRHIHRALELRSSDEIYLTMSNLLTVEGKLHSAHKYVDIALQLDPLSAMNYHYKGFLFYLQEKYEAALPYFRKSLQLKPELPFPHVYLGAIPLLEGRPEESLSYFERLSGHQGGELTKLGGRAFSHAALGNEQATEACIRQLEAALDSDAQDNAIKFLMYTYTVLGKYEEAIQLFEQAIDDKMPMVLLFYTEPLLRPLRNLPRFRAPFNKILDQSAPSAVLPDELDAATLPEKRAAEYYRHLESYMREKQPYLQPGLTLRALAEMIGLAPNDLSRLLNEKAGMNFYHYVNRYRLDAFRQRVTGASQTPAEASRLAEQSGFKSQAALRTYLRESADSAPGEFLESFS